MWAVLTGRSTISGFDLAWFRSLCFQSTSVSLVFMVLYSWNFLLHSLLYLLLSWVWWDWPLTWLTNHRPSVLWHCWLGHVTRKIEWDVKHYYTILYHTDSSTFHALHCRRAVFEPSRMLVHLCGTFCPFISRTAIWLLQLSCAILSLISFFQYWFRIERVWGVVT